jgi:aldehyde:ferredoxin oxidoreductase
MRQEDIDNRTRDLAAFIALSTEAISRTIEPSVVAWEKRGYWVKADRFRLEWGWAETLGTNMRNATLKEDWSTIAITAAQIAEKLSSVTVSERHRMGAPWVGAWDQLKIDAEK